MVTAWLLNGYELRDAVSIEQQGADISGAS